MSGNYLKFVIGNLSEKKEIGFDNMFLTLVLCRDQQLNVNQSLVGFEAIGCKSINILFRILINDQLKNNPFREKCFINVIIFYAKEIIKTAITVFLTVQIQYF